MTDGVRDLGNGCFAYLQDCNQGSGWGWSNSGLIVDGAQAPDRGRPTDQRGGCGDRVAAPARLHGSIGDDVRPSGLHVDPGHSDASAPPGAVGTARGGRGVARWSLALYLSLRLLGHAHGNVAERLRPRRLADHNAARGTSFRRSGTDQSRPRFPDANRLAHPASGESGAANCQRIGMGMIRGCWRRWPRAKPQPV